MNGGLKKTKQFLHKNSMKYIGRNTMHVRMMCVNSLHLSIKQSRGMKVECIAQRTMCTSTGYSLWK